MSDQPVATGPRPADAHPRLRLVALIAVIAGVVLLAASAFVLSYSGIHQIALEAGVTGALARLYPIIFDAMLVIALAAALALRGAGWWMRVYVWLSLLLLLAAVSTGDALHAMNVALPRQPSRAAVAVVPWLLLLLGFGLWLVMLRQWRRARSATLAPAAAGAAGAGSADPDPAPVIVRSPVPAPRPALAGPAPARPGPAGSAPAGSAPARPARTGLDAMLEGPAVRSPRVAPAEQAAGAGYAEAGLAGVSWLGDDGPADEPGVAPGGEAHPVAGEGVPEGTHGAGTDGAGTDGEQTDRAGTDGADTHGEGAGAGQLPPPASVSAPVPHFDRMHSTPTPPEE